MLTKSIRLTKEDAIGLADVVEKDPRVERGSSEALRICFEDAAANIPNWKEIVEKAKKLDYKSIKIDESALDTKTFLVDDDVFHTVLESINSQLGMSKPRISYITRLCIYSARLKFYPEQEDVKVKNIDAVELMQRACNKTAELIRAGRVKEIEKYMEV